MDEQSVIVHALTSDGVAKLVTGGGQQCQRLGTITVHSYPTEGQDGDPCECGRTRRGEVQPG